MPYTNDGIGFQKTDTSYQAAINAAKTAPTIREAVHALLAGANKPMSTEAIAAALNKPECSVQPRISELRNDDMVKPSGETGESKWGQTVILWEVV